MDFLDKANPGQIQNWDFIWELISDSKTLPRLQLLLISMASFKASPPEAKAIPVGPP